MAAVCAFTLGIVGLWQISRYPNAGLSGTDIAYGSLSLFFVQPPGLPPGVDLPISYEIARFLAPAATAYALADTLVNPMARIQTAMSRGHAVVCGSGPTVLAFAERLRAAGRHVVLVDDSASPEMADHARRLGLVLLRGDPRREETLRRAGLHRADQLYVCGTASGYNAAVVASAELVSRRRRRRPLACYAEESDPDVLDALWTLLLGREHIGHLTVEFFNTSRLGAGMLLTEERIMVAPPGQSVVIVGLGPFGREVFLEVARRRKEVGGPRMRVTVVDRNASAVLELLRSRYPFVDTAVDLVWHDRAPDEIDLDALLGRGGADGSAQLVFVCYEDEELALRKALALSRIPAQRRVVVRVDRMTTFGRAFGTADGARPLDVLYRHLTVFPLLDRVCDPERLQDPLIEQLAKGIHRDYCRQRLAAGERPEDNGAIVAWENLSEDLQNANYQQARDIHRKLDLISCEILAGASRDEPFTFRENGATNEVEFLARREHERWSVERSANGWRYGPVRDNDQKIHPELRPWDDLDEAVRDKDRETISLIPTILAEAGFRVARRPT